MEHDVPLLEDTPVLFQWAYHDADPTDSRYEYHGHAAGRTWMNLLTGETPEPLNGLAAVGFGAGFGLAMTFCLAMLAFGAVLAAQRKGPVRGVPRLANRLRRWRRTMTNEASSPDVAVATAGVGEYASEAGDGEFALSASLRREDSGLAIDGLAIEHPISSGRLGNISIRLFDAPGRSCGGI